MPTLERRIAEHVLTVLEARQCLRVSTGSHDLLAGELESAAGPLLTSVTPYLMAAHAAAVTTSTSFGDPNADEAVLVMVDAIGERLAHSNHVDDFFVDDATVRRITQRAMRDVLSAYLRGEFAIEEDLPGEDRLVVRLDGLGYVIATTANRATEDDMLVLLERSAADSGHVFETYDAERHVASFSMSSANADPLALEEALGARTRDLLASGRVRLPCVEQLFELPARRYSTLRLGDALREATSNIERRSNCLAVADRVPPRRLRLAVTPLSTEAALHVDATFDELITLVEAALERAAHLPTRKASTPTAARSAVHSATDSQIRRRATTPRAAAVEATAARGARDSGRSTKRNTKKA